MVYLRTAKLQMSVPLFQEASCTVQLDRVAGHRAEKADTNTMNTSEYRRERGSRCNT